MKYSIVYSSLTGNTKLLADELNKNLKSNDCLYCGELNDKALEADFIFVGFWTDRGTCDKKCQEFLKKIKNKEIFLFGTVGFGVSADYFKTVIDKVKDNLDKSVIVKDYFMCQGKMQQAVRDRYEEIRRTDPSARNINMLIANFDEALSHPNKKDINNFIKKVKELK